MKDEQIKNLEQMAELQFTDAELQLISGLRTQEMQSLEAKVAIATGRLRAEAAVRQSIRTMAEQGSSQAQKQFIALVEQRKQNN